MKKLHIIVACVCLFSIVFFTLCFYYAPEFLSSPSSTPRYADVIVVLGGDDTRIFRAVDLYRQGLAKKIILPWHQNKTITPSEFYSNKYVKMFFSLGASPSDIYLDNVSENTWEEAVNTLSLMQAQGWSNIMVVSDALHMRRVDWVWSKITKNTSFHYILVATQPKGWHPDHWWRNRQTDVDIRLECMKLVYYWFVYSRYSWNRDESLNNNSYL